jgi:hypothetical protein
VRPRVTRRERFTPFAITELCDAAGSAWHRSASGWASLTSSERSVAVIIAEGVTSREAAARLFPSRHPIDFHLRQIFWTFAIRPKPCSRMARGPVEFLAERGQAVGGARGQHGMGLGTY